MQLTWPYLELINVDRNHFYVYFIKEVKLEFNINLPKNITHRKTLHTVNSLHKILTDVKNINVLQFLFSFSFLLYIKLKKDEWFGINK